ncbi:DUF4214 domain-containing protein [Pseudomonas sp. LJDD11]|uniref:DUF4214 domain-containing protein n=1 Tax=unclassified Pseudomonas TaxID=196821 RepID=UPI0004F75027|nr:MULTISPECIES: DUF4214 domain-containing protein [unclassified Pseudomonas]MCQ9425453.1 DUF4214 domain-containing protein [Pseudomonas sp. LJDD11]BAP45635.1 putative uncharacterized protein [Pseudomonas sp. StFLB209]
MATEVSPARYPYSTAVFIKATFASGDVYIGSGSVVGRNDILTATHVVYDPDLGGYATRLEFYVGADYNFRTGRFDSTPLVSLTDADWQVLAYPNQVFQNSNNNTLTQAESQYDVALIGLDVAVGDQVGYMGLASGYNQSIWANSFGYPGGSTGLMYGSAYIHHDARYSTYTAYAYEGSDILDRGSSGGPLYVTDSTGSYVIGVKSSGSSTVDVWADIGLVYDDLIGFIASNDAMLATTTAAVQTGTTGNDVFFASPAADHFQGLDGLDSVSYNGLRSSYEVSRNDTLTNVTRLAATEDRDTLTGIERLKFQDGTLALDTGAGQTAGSAYRLYQAALDRTPDTGGLRYWVTSIDNGESLLSVANGFMASEEFRTLYGASQTQSELLTAFYRNVLNREPDAGGFNYWINELNSGLSIQGMLVSFSESSENIANLAGNMSQGIWLG